MVKMGFGDFFKLVFLPYEAKPLKPTKDLPKETKKISDEQFAQCQEIYKESEARNAQIERKAQWTFAIIAFFVPAFAAVFVFLLDGPACEKGNYPYPLALLGIASLSLTLSIITALRGMTIHSREILFIEAIIDRETGDFVEYKKERHAQGLLYCAMMNTVTDDHISQLVKSAHALLGFSAVLFAVVVGITVYQTTGCAGLSGS